MAMTLIYKTPAAEEAQDVTQLPHRHF